MDNKFHGQGTITYSNGNKYDGQFENDRFHGHGTFTSADGGGRYIGEWMDDNRHGQGTHTYFDGTVAEGVWKNDIFQGVSNNSPSPKSTVLQIAFTQLSQSQRRQIQSNLSNLSLYASSVDGVYGKGTAAALTLYN